MVLLLDNLVWVYFKVREQIEEFKEHMPIIQTLGNPGMKERHWERVSEIIGFPIRVDAELTLAKVIDYGLDEYIDKFEAISEAATKENNLEKHLNKMLSEWVDMEFSAHLYRYYNQIATLPLDENSLQGHRNVYIVGH